MGFNENGLALYIIIMIAIIGFSIIVGSIILYWRIVSKMGFPGVLSLLNLIPLVNIALLGYLAFAEWPIHLELRNLKAKQGENSQ